MVSLVPVSGTGHVISSHTLLLPNRQEKLTAFIKDGANDITTFQNGEPWVQCTYFSYVKGCRAN
jgi:hypothetical protein